MGVGGQRHAPAALPPVKETRYSLYRRLGGPQGRSRWVRKISPPSIGIRTPDSPSRSESLYRLSKHVFLYCELRVLMTGNALSFRIKISDKIQRLSFVYREKPLQVTYETDTSQRGVQHAARQCDLSKTPHVRH
jgi:hypothetical protein